MRQIIAVDSESHRITPTRKTPRLVCVTWATRDAAGEIASGIYDRAGGLAFYRWVLPLVARGGAILTGQNIFYDLGVAVAEAPDLLEVVFEGFAIGGFRDVKERQKLIDLADGSMKYMLDPDTGEFLKQFYDLGTLAMRLCGMSLEKPAGGACRNDDGEGLSPYVPQHLCGCGTWRLHYEELDGVPVEQYPEPARRYAVADAVGALRCTEEQDRRYGVSPVVQWDAARGEVYVVDEANQMRAGWAFALATIWGMETDLPRVRRLQARLAAEQEEVLAKLGDADEENPCGAAGYTPGAGDWRCARRRGHAGLCGPEAIYRAQYHPRGGKEHAPGSTSWHKCLREIRRRVAEGHLARGLEIPLAPKGGVKTSEEALRDSGDPDLEILAESMEGQKVATAYLPHFERGSIHSSTNLILETGRSSTYNPSTQQFPREMDSAPEDTVRACIKAREGTLFAACDIKQAELVGLAEECVVRFGWSRLADAINAGMDVHLMMAAKKLGLTYDEAKARKEEKEIAKTRQIAKGPDFGIPGGMGDAKLVLYVRSQPGKHVITLEEAHAWRQIALTTWQEWDLYFRWAKQEVGRLGETTHVDRTSGRMRGGCSFTKFCNQNFQGIVANWAKFAAWLVSRECHVVRESPLYGSHLVAFNHDELVIETPRHRAHEAAMRLKELVELAGRHYIKHVRVEADVFLSAHLYKAAKAVTDEAGRLVEWVPPNLRAERKVAA